MEQLVSDPFDSYVILAALHTRRTEGLNFHGKRLFYKRYHAEQSRSNVAYGGGQEFAFCIP